MSKEPHIQSIQPQKLREILKGEGQCHVIDVRELAEVQSEFLECATHTPLSSFDQHKGSLNREHDIYVLCRSGNRAKKAALQLHSEGYPNIHIVEGGLEAWKAAGLEVKKGHSKVWSLERQVRFTAGLLVIAGVLLGFFAHPNWFVLSGGIAFGLMFSAATDTCGMGMILAKMPWNQRNYS